MNKQHAKESFNLFHVVYGSKLYGTNTAKSDTDEKVIYVPSLDSLLLGKKNAIYKERFDEDNNPIADNAPMPDRGIETEYFPVQTFVRDFVNGQTYALEIAFAYLSYGPPKHGIAYTTEHPTYMFVKELVERFSNAEVYSMVGFAMKQTFDYVKRGERLNDAKHVLNVLDGLLGVLDSETRLSHMLGEPEESVLDYIAKNAGLKTGVQNGGNKPQRSLELNGRSYLESTTLIHLRDQVVKIMKQFGDRSSAAAETDVDYKSLSHAVRVYQQAIELLDTGTITFPRPNAPYLLTIKEGREDLETVKSLLLSLDDEVQAKILSSTMRKKTPEMVAEAEEWLLTKLHEFYDIYEFEE